MRKCGDDHATHAFQNASENENGKVRRDQTDKVAECKQTKRQKACPARRRFFLEVGYRHQQENAYPALSGLKHTNQSFADVPVFHQ